MSIALLKNVLFPAEKRSRTRQPVVTIHNQTACASSRFLPPRLFPLFHPTDLASPTDSNPERASSNQSHKDSEVSWLSCQSSIEGEGHNAPPPPLPEKDLANVQSVQSSNVDMEAQKAPETLRRRSFTLSPRMISDAIIGVSDGMTVPFALTAGLASLGDTKLVVLGGLAELIAGAISMGLGGFIGAKSEA